jgi:phytoene synthase
MSDKNFLSIYAKSFNWAGFFLPKKTYNKCSALYDFCRIVDNIADNDENLEQKKKNFLQLEKDFNQKNFNNIIVKNMWSLINEFNISLNVVNDLFEGIKSDIKEKVKLNSEKDLLIYSYRVAGTVGLMMAKILRVTKKSSLMSAIDLGIAMQLTNISRDVIEDSKKNRSYIDQSFDEIVSTIKLADDFYDSSFYSIKEIPINLRFSILVARRIYRKIGYKIIKKKNFENYKKCGKIYVTNLEKILETFLSFYDLIKLSLINKDDDEIKHNHSIINKEINLDERI